MLLVPMRLLTKSFSCTVETEDGWERAVTVLGPAKSGKSGEMLVKFSDGTVDDWDVEDFVASKQLPNDLVKLVVSSQVAVLTSECRCSYLTDLSSFPDWCSVYTACCS
eukprot:COSAG02_NODE_5441_length_4327_cov_32.830889_2_plen_108_part_00